MLCSSKRLKIVNKIVQECSKTIEFSDTNQTHIQQDRYYDTFHSESFFYVFFYGLLCPVASRAFF